jgi:dolichol-phosphate mannosyltransferase/undecaprenyl-phosphate 4-deoxy-4-formamido-L-arabinose transferase
MKYSIIVPVYNTVRPLEELVNRIKNVFYSIEAEYEIIMVEDCSPKIETWQTLEALAKNYTSVIAIQLSRNFGQQPATLCGLALATGDFMITMDDDLQHSPEDIPKLIEKNDHDIVIGQFSERKHSLFKRAASRVKSYFDRILIGKPRHIRLSPFRMINRTTVDGMLAIRTPSPFIPALMFHISKDVVGVTFEHHYRSEGKSNYTFRKMLGVFNNLIIGNSSFLLKAIGYLGVIIAFFSLIYAALIVFEQLVNPTSIPGWTSVIVSILFVGGLLLFSVGIMGEYLIRIIAGVESRPSYVIRKRIN